ncbi:MAG: hypothetical protein R2822_13780 [Spirosomataceae bacterium]
MKSLKNYRVYETNKPSLLADQAVWLAGLTLLIIGYILFSFLYPMISKGLLF